MNRTASLLTLGLLLLWSLAAGARESKVTVVPTEMCRGYFFVPVSLGDPDENRTLWLLYDTGASDTFVDPDSLERVSGQRVKVGRRANIVSSTAGPVEFSNMRARVLELDHLSTMLGREIDGILAVDAFKKFLLVLDYGSQQMTIEKGSLPRPDGETVFSAKGRDKRPWLEMRVGSRERRMLIDSGAALTGFVVNDLETYETLTPLRAVGASMRLKKIEKRRGARLRGDVSLGPHTFEQPVLMNTDGSELIGGKIMSYFRWTFDQRRKRVRVERLDPAVPFESPPYISHGMIVVPTDGEFVVRGVLEDSPADRAGVREKDRITHIDGEPIAQRGCEQRDRDEITLSVQRDGQEMDVEVALFPLVE